jgi:hypothetical protein
MTNNYRCGYRKQEPRLLVMDHVTMIGRIVTLSQFCADNASDADLCEDCRCLAQGFGFTIGGGAAPAISISRWS